MTIKIKDIQTFAVLTEPETQVVIGGNTVITGINFPPEGVYDVASDASFNNDLDLLNPIDDSYGTLADSLLGRNTSSPNSGLYSY